METTKEKEIPLVKKSSSYKIIIPAKVERLIRFLCEKVWETEWSGVLFYNPVGNFEDNSLEIHCVDILPMDIGSTTYTEFNMSPDVISYMAQNPELLDCKTGLIHSHNNMSTFFSATDLATLEEEGKDMKHFVSLIVNNAGKYTAAITRRVTYKDVREVSYNSFDDTMRLSGPETFEGEELEYFPLDIVFEEEVNNQFAEVDERLKSIKEKKEKARTFSASAPLASNYYYPKTTWPPYDAKDFEEKTTIKQPTLFDDLPPEQQPKVKPNTEKHTLDLTDNEEKYLESIVTDEVIDQIVTQLITGCVTVTKLDAESKKKLADTITQRFNKRFGTDKEGMRQFNYWATDFLEFLLWYSVEDPLIDDDVITSELAAGVIKALGELPKSPYIDEYIDIIISYANRA